MNKNNRFKNIITMVVLFILIMPFQNCVKFQSKGMIINDQSSFSNSGGIPSAPPSNNSGSSGGSSSGNTTAKIKVPVGVIRWDAFNKTIYNRNVDSTWNDPTPEERSALSKEEFYDLQPYHAKRIPGNYIDKNVRYDSSGWVFQNIFNNVEFNGDSVEVVNQDNIYAQRAGIDYWLFLYYPTGETPLANTRVVYESLVDKKGIKAAFTCGLLGRNRDQNLQHIVDSFDKDWYQKIDGKPLLFAESGKDADVNEIKARYGKPIYIVDFNMVGGGIASEAATRINSQGYQAGSWYSTWPAGDGLHSSAMRNEFFVLDSYKNTSFQVVPNLTINFHQKARSEFYSTIGRGSPGYSTRATLAENRQQFEYFKNFIDQNPNQVKTMIMYSWNEHSEGGIVMCPRLNRDNTINTDLIDLAAEYLK